MGVTPVICEFINVLVKIYSLNICRIIFVGDTFSDFMGTLLLWCIKMWLLFLCEKLIHFEMGPGEKLP